MIDPVTPASLRQNRALILATIVLFAGGFMVAWHHQATANHGFCSDHGRLIHLKEQLRTSEASPAGTASLQGHRHVAGDHDCVMLAFLGQSVLRVQWQVPPISTAASPVSPSAGQRIPPPQLDPLSQSPKQSPPRG